MYAQYQIVLAKAVVQIISLHVHYLSTNKTHPKKYSAKNCQVQNDVILSRLYGIKLLHANVQCVYKVDAEYQMDSVKALVQAGLKVHALSEH